MECITLERYNEIVKDKNLYKTAYERVAYSISELFKELSESKIENAQLKKEIAGAKVYIEIMKQTENPVNLKLLEKIKKLEDNTRYFETVIKTQAEVIKSKDIEIFKNNFAKDVNSLAAAVLNRKNAQLWEKDAEIEQIKKQLAARAKKTNTEKEKDRRIVELEKLSCDFVKEFEKRGFVKDLEPTKNENPLFKGASFFNFGTALPNDTPTDKISPELLEKLKVMLDGKNGHVVEVTAKEFDQIHKIIKRDGFFSLEGK